jgi:hypothetical protein
LRRYSNDAPQLPRTTIISALSNGTLVTHKNSAGKNASAPLRGAYFYPFIRMSMAEYALWCREAMACFLLKVTPEY